MPQSQTDAVEKTVKQHLRLVYAAALRQTRRADLAEDVTQAVFILFVQKHRQIPAEHTAGWLVKTAYFTARQAIRTKQRRTHHEKQAAMNIPRSTTELSSDLSEVLDKGLSRLAMRSRTAVALRYLEGQPVAEVAHTLKVSENAATKIISRGLNKLRHYLQSENPNLSLAPAALTAALLDIAAKNPVADVSHLSARILTHGVAPKASSAALAHATGKILLWAKLQTMAAILCTVLIVAGAGGVALHEAGWTARAANARQPRLQFRLVEKSPAAATQPFTLMTDISRQREKLAVDNQILLDESAVQSATEEPAQDGSSYSVDITFTPSGAAKDAQITSENIGRRLAIVFDGKLLSAPDIRSEVGGYATIAGDFSKSEADAIVRAIGGDHPTSPATQAAAAIIIRDFGYTLSPTIQIPITAAELLKSGGVFISLEHRRLIKPPIGLHWNPDATTLLSPELDRWISTNDTNLFLAGNGAALRIFGVQSSCAPSPDFPTALNTDSFNALLQNYRTRWAHALAPAAALPFNFYVRTYSHATAIVQIAADPFRSGNYILRYRLIVPDPSAQLGTNLALDSTEFLYARAFQTTSDSHCALRLIVAGQRFKDLPSSASTYSGGIFFNGQLLATGQFDVLMDASNSDIYGVIDAPVARGQTIVQQLNRQTPDNGYKRFLRLYALNKGEPLRHILPPYPPERQTYAMWPRKLSPNALFICRCNDGFPEAQQDYVPDRHSNKPQAISLADILHDVAGLKNYEFFIDPALRQTKLAGDFVVDPAATVEQKLAALQEIFSKELGRRIQVQKRSMRRSVIVALGHYDFTPLPGAVDANELALTADTNNLDRVQRYSDVGAWQTLLDTIGDDVGVRMASVVDNPPEQIEWMNYATIWYAYDNAKQATDPKRLNAILQMLSTQTNLDFKIETRDEPTYVISPAP